MPSLSFGTAHSKVRTGQPNHDASSSEVATRTSTAPARRASASSASGSKVWTSTTASSAAARDDSSSSSCGRRHADSTGSRVSARRRPPGEARQPPGDVVAARGRLAGEDEPAAGLEHAQDLGEAAVEVGDVVQHGVADDDVEGVVVVGQPFGIGDPALDLEAEAARVALRDLDHARAQIGDVALVDDAGELEVEREEAGAAAQFERRRGRASRRCRRRGRSGRARSRCSAGRTRSTTSRRRCRPPSRGTGCWPASCRARRPRPLRRSRAGSRWRPAARPARSPEHRLARAVLEERLHAGGAVVGGEQRREQV